jgi:hypothetical protein
LGLSQINVPCDPGFFGLSSFGFGGAGLTTGGGGFGGF